MSQAAIGINFTTHGAQKVSKDMSAIRISGKATVDMLIGINNTLKRLNEKVLLDYVVNLNELKLLHKSLKIKSRKTKQELKDYNPKLKS